MKNRVIILAIATATALLCFTFVVCSNKEQNTSKANESSQTSTVTTNNTGNSDEQSKATASTNNNTNEKFDSNAFIKKVKDYILNGQNDLPEAGRLNWTKSFLDATDIDTLLEKYIGQHKDIDSSTDKIKAFATYLTENASVLKNWKDLFEAEFKKTYDQKIVKYEDLGNGLYQVYVDYESKTVPYVVVNAKTGYYHG